MSASERESFLDRLRDQHSFPGPFVFKVVGENTPQFVARVLQAVVVVLGPQAQPTVTTRQSSGGRHQSITIRVRVDSAEDVAEIYEALQAVPGVRVLL